MRILFGRVGDYIDNKDVENDTYKNGASAENDPSSPSFDESKSDDWKYSSKHEKMNWVWNSFKQKNSTSGQYMANVHSM